MTSLHSGMVWLISWIYPLLTEKISMDNDSICFMSHIHCIRPHSHVIPDVTAGYATWGHAIITSSYVSHQVMTYVTASHVMCRIRLCHVSHKTMPCVTLDSYAMCHIRSCHVSHQITPCVTLVWIMSCVTFDHTMCHIWSYYVSHQIMPCVTSGQAMCHIRPSATWDHVMYHIRTCHVVVKSSHA